MLVRTHLVLSDRNPTQISLNKKGGNLLAHVTKKFRCQLQAWLDPGINIIKELSFHFDFSILLPSESVFYGRQAFSLRSGKRVACLFSWLGLRRGRKELCFLNVHRPILRKDYEYWLTNEWMWFPHLNEGRNLSFVHCCISQTTIVWFRTTHMF